MAAALREHRHLRLSSSCGQATVFKFSVLDRRHIKIYVSTVYGKYFGSLRNLWA